VLQVRIIPYTHIYTNSHLIIPIYTSLGLCVLNSNLNESNRILQTLLLNKFYPKNIFKSGYSCESKPTALIPAVAEPPELHWLKYASPLSRALTHFKRCNPLVCRVSARYNHGSTGPKQVYLARRRVYNHSTAHYL
jgi:hypothetical protein